MDIRRRDGVKSAIEYLGECMVTDESYDGGEAALFECLRRQSHRVVRAAENDGAAFGLSLNETIAQLRGWLETINERLGILDGNCAPWERPSSMH